MHACVRAVVRGRPSGFVIIPIFMTSLLPVLLDVDDTYYVFMTKAASSRGTQQSCSWKNSTACCRHNAAPKHRTSIAVRVSVTDDVIIILYFSSSFSRNNVCVRFVSLLLCWLFRCFFFVAAFAASYYFFFFSSSWRSG